ncbi:MAG: HD-GYP domain-containing protein [Fimbriimonas sp.]
MRVTDRSSATLRLWLLLTAAFFATAAMSGWVVFQLSADRTLVDVQRDALGLARSLALQVSVLPAPMARRATFAAREDFPGAQRTAYLPIEDGKAQGHVWEPRLAREAIASDIAVVSSNISEGDQSPVLVAYAPVRAGGRTIALVGVEMHAEEAVADLRHLRTVGILGLAFAGLLGAIFAAAFARGIFRAASERRLTRLMRSRMFVRNTLLEIGMAAVAGVVLLGGMLGVFGFRNLRTEELASRGRTQSLESLYREIARATTTGGDLQAVTQQARALGIRGKGAAALMAATDAAFAEAELRQDQLHEQQVSYIQGISVAMILSAMLTVAALILLRGTAAREQELEEAEHEAARSEAARQQVAENLPIGFYTFGPDQIQYTNEAWRRLVEQEEGEEPTVALGRALHPDEREAVMAALRDAVATGSGFGFGHRFVTRAGDIRHVESRGVPILDERGTLEHVVGFSIDVTARVRTRDLLESKTREVEATNARLRQALGDLEENFEAMVHTLVKAVEAKDPYTAGHSERVMEYSVRVGRALGLSPHELRVLRMGALIHDVGKIGVPDAILTKPSALTDEEFAIVRTHPEVGAGMIEGIPKFRECVPIVLLHHERLNGSGYPFGVFGTEIPLGVRIVAVADCFDAMTSTRAYRKGLDPAVAIEALWKSVAEGALDEKIVAQLADTVRRDGLIAHESIRPAA